MEQINTISNCNFYIFSYFLKGRSDIVSDIFLRNFSERFKVYETWKEEYLFVRSSTCQNMKSQIS